MCSIYLFFYLLLLSTSVGYIIIFSNNFGHMAMLITPPVLWIKIKIFCSIDKMTMLVLICNGFQEVDVIKVFLTEEYIQKGLKYYHPLLSFFVVHSHVVNYQT